MNRFAKICMAGWTIFCFIGSCSGMMNLSRSTQGHELNGAEALGAGMGLFIWLVVWAVPMIVLGIIALVSRPTTPSDAPKIITPAPPHLCSECGKYYVADVFVCPFCGSAAATQNVPVHSVSTLLQQASQRPEVQGSRQQHRSLIIIGLVVIAIIGVIVITSSNPSNTATNATQPAPSESNSIGETAATQVTTVQLYSAYKRNEILADSQYKGKRLIVEGVVREIRKDMFDDAVIELMTANEFESVSVYLEKGEEVRAAELSKGMNITVLCIGDGATLGSPTLRKCRFVPEGYSSHTPAERTTVAYKSGGLTASVIENMTYSFGAGQYAQSIKFVGGQARSDTETYSIDKNTVVFGSLNSLEQPAAVLVMDDSGGGSGTFRSLIAVWNANGTLMNSEEKDLGDRIVVNSISISTGIVTVDMLTQGPNDGLCCPTQRKILRLALRGNQFVEVQ